MTGRLRAMLHAGRGRQPLALLALGIAFASAWNSWPVDEKSSDKILDTIQRVAFLTAAFSVTAYNLRTRVIDLTLKIDAAPSRTAGYCAIARDCGKRLTNLVFLFSFVASGMAAAGFATGLGQVSKTIGSLLVGFFVLSLVHFVYIIFAFERLERFVLDDAEEKSREKEAKRLLGN